jgi:hypothetical protein
MNYIKKLNEFVSNIEISNLINDVEVDCKYLSDTGYVSNHKSYRKIVEFGKESLPFLVEKLSSNTAMFWISALEEITGNVFDDTKSEKLISNWKKWALENVK